MWPVIREQIGPRMYQGPAITGLLSRVAFFRRSIRLAPRSAAGQLVRHQRRAQSGQPGGYDTVICLAAVSGDLPPTQPSSGNPGGPA